MSAELDPDARARLLEALAAGENVSAAARRAGYSRVHAHRVMKDPGFAAELERARATAAAAGETARGAEDRKRLKELEELALETLETLAQKAHKTDNVREAAARDLLRHVRDRLDKVERVKAARTPVASPELRVLPVQDLVPDKLADEQEGDAWRKAQG